MTETEITDQCYLSTFAWIFPTLSAVHFLAFAFLVISFWSKECVITGIEGLTSSGSLTNMTGTLFRMRNTFCWLHEHLVRLRTQQQLIFPPCLDIPSSLSRALSCLRLSGHNFLGQRLRHDRNRRPYELRICDRCDWHTIQDEEHILLDCPPHEHLVRLRTQQQLTFPPQFEDSPARLRTFMNQPDIFGVASFVAKCLALFP